MKNSQKGFLPILIVLLIAAIVGGGAYIISTKSVSDISKSEQVDTDTNSAKEQKQEVTDSKTTETTKTDSNAITATASTNKTVVIKDVKEIKPGVDNYIFIQSSGQHIGTPTLVVKINGSENFPMLTYGALFTVSWSAPDMEKCDVNGFGGIPYKSGGSIGDSDHYGKPSAYGNAGSEQFYARVFNDFVSPLQITVSCYGGSKAGDRLRSINAQIGIPVKKPTSSFTFITPKAGQVFTYQDPVSITWKTDRAVSTILTSIHRASDGHEVNPERMRTPSLVGGEIKELTWTIPAYLSPGNYYFQIDSLNKVTSTYKSSVFTVKEPDTKKEGQYTFADYKIGMEQNPTLKSNFIIDTAYLEHDASGCSALTNDNNKYECILGVAKVSNNLQLCYSIPTTYNYASVSRDACASGVAIKNVNYKACEVYYADRKTDKEYCAMRVKLDNGL